MPLYDEAKIKWIHLNGRKTKVRWGEEQHMIRSAPPHLSNMLETVLWHECVWLPKQRPHRALLMTWLINVSEWSLSINSGFGRVQTSGSYWLFTIFTVKGRFMCVLMIAYLDYLRAPCIWKSFSVVMHGGQCQNINVLSLYVDRRPEVSQTVPCMWLSSYHATAAVPGQRTLTCGLCGLHVASYIVPLLNTTFQSRALIHFNSRVLGVHKSHVSDIRYDGSENSTGQFQCVRSASQGWWSCVGLSCSKGLHTGSWVRGENHRTVFASFPCGL